MDDAPSHDARHIGRRDTDRRDHPEMQRLETRAESSGLGGSIPLREENGSGDLKMTQR